MTSPILFCGGEDLSFTTLGSAVGGAFITVDSTAGRFRAGYARHGLSLSNSSVAGNGLVPANALALITPSLSKGAGGVAVPFWATARFFGVSGSTNGTSTAGQNLWEFRDSNNVLRLRMANTNTSTGPVVFIGPYSLFKVSAAGVSTQLGSNTLSGLTASPTAPDKIDVFVNYAVAGQLTVYINGTQVFSFTGDITTDSQTSVDVWRLQQAFTASFNTSASHVWSEVIVSTRDTRAMNLVTTAPSAAGNAATFTSSAAANVNASLWKDNIPDYSITAAQIDEYTVTPALPTGNFSVISVVQHVRAAAGISGPTKFDFMVRTGGTDFLSSDYTPANVWGLFANNWDTNPNTGVPWVTTDLPASSTSFNMGLKSVT